MARAQGLETKASLAEKKEGAVPPVTDGMSRGEKKTYLEATPALTTPGPCPPSHPSGFQTCFPDLTKDEVKIHLQTHEWDLQKVAGTPQDAGPHSLPPLSRR